MTIDEKYNTHKTYNEQIKLDNERVKFKVKCPCGHTITIVNADRTICSHCGHWVYKNKQIEFRYKMQEEIRRKNDRSTKKSI